MNLQRHFRPILVAFLLATSIGCLSSQAKEFVKVDRDERPVQLLLLWPAEGPITSGFGPRKHGWHSGIDIDGHKGDPVVAAGEGEVVFVGRAGAYGKVIEVAHPGGMATIYAHLEKAIVHKGQMVRQGEVIASMGRSGNARGTHLHFEVRDLRGVVDDPLKHLPHRRNDRLVIRRVGSANEG